ncbi:MAG: Hsp20/alpha crystallin family protein [wastewater metagenome]|nr:Hsp20/alpha crystallin family protein [Candidatus Loosdrechtia aerotolerans]
MARQLARWSRLPTISSLQDEMNRMIDRFFREWDMEPGAIEAGTWAPPVDLSESDDKIFVKAELPGIDPHDINISVQGNTLMLNGEKKEEKEEKGKNYYCIERRYGKFSRTIDLPSSVNPDRVNAEYRNGVLEITMEKKEAARPKQIPIKTE